MDAGHDDAQLDPATAAALAAQTSQTGSSSAQGASEAAGARPAGAYTLSGAPVEPMPAGWGTAAAPSGSGSGQVPLSRSPAIASD